MTFLHTNLPLRILVSTQSYESLMTLVKDSFHSGIELLNSEDQKPGVTFDAALISRDVTATSTKQSVIPSTQAFYDLLLGNPDLKWVQIHSAGADRQIYLDLMKRGAIITGSSGVNAQVVMQNTIAGVLMLARHFPKMLKAQSQKRWDSLINYPLPADLLGQTAVVIGRGPIGKAICRGLEVFGVNVIPIGFDSRLKTQPAQNDSYHFSDLHQVLPKAQWLILACPLSAETRNLINKAVIDLLPNGAFLINIARGEIVVESDLIEALRSKQLAGAYLDVFATEPLDSSSPLWDLENVIITPHSAGHSAGNELRVLHLFMENLGAFQRGDQLKNQIILNT
jgi:phosphoglycerate dehydrogenase-like enzyme